MVTLVHRPSRPSVKFTPLSVPRTEEYKRNEQKTKIQIKSVIKAAGKWYQHGSANLRSTPGSIQKCR